MNTEKRPEGIDLTQKLNSEFTGFFKTAIKAASSAKGYKLAFIRHFLWQRAAAKQRLNQEKKGVHVPPFLIHSVTQKCNLNCKGCYAKNLHNRSSDEFPIENTIKLFKEADELGISVIMLAGGEPLLKEGLIAASSKFPRIIFPLFTNGTLITDVIAKQIKAPRNIIPILSLEGESFATDSRRGAGVHKLVTQAFDILRENNVLFGVSITATSQNFDSVTDPRFVNKLKTMGAAIIFYIEYIPCEQNSDELVLTNEQRNMLKQRLEDMRKSTGLLFISFPGDEEMFGGCLAAGRGFVHVGSSGRVEPCPFSPFSDSNLSEMSLKDALKSKFLEEIRNNHENLSEHKGGCALWENREWVEKVLSSKESNN